MFLHIHEAALISTPFFAVHQLQSIIQKLQVAALLQA